MAPMSIQLQESTCFSEQDMFGEVWFCVKNVVEWNRHALELEARITAAKCKSFINTPRSNNQWNCVLCNIWLHTDCRSKEAPFKEYIGFRRIHVDFLLLNTAVVFLFRSGIFSNENRPVFFSSENRPCPLNENRIHLMYFGHSV